MLKGDVCQHILGFQHFNCVKILSFCNSQVITSLTTMTFNKLAKRRDAISSHLKTSLPTQGDVLGDVIASN